MKREIFGMTVELNEAWRFHVGELERDFDSISEAREAIEAAQKRAAATKKAKLNLPVVDSEGIKRTITGIHAGNGNATVSPKADTQRIAVYPDVPWIIKTIDEYNRLQGEVERHRWMLQEFRIECDPGYRKHYTPDEITALHAKMTNAAQETDYETEKAKHKSERMRF